MPLVLQYKTHLFCKSFIRLLVDMLNKYKVKQLRYRCVTYVTFQEVGILIILDPEGKKWNGSHKNQSPQPLADPRSRAQVRTPSLRRGSAPIFGGGFIHVCGHPGSQWRLLWWRHCHEMTVRKGSFGLWVLQQMIYPSVLCLPQLFHPVVTLWNLSFSCTDFTPINVEPLAAVQLRQRTNNTNS